MTDKLSERAEQSEGIDWKWIERVLYCDCFLHPQQFCDKCSLLGTIHRLADSANLARGLALEQAAQICDEQVRLSQAIEDGDEALPHANGHSLELDEYKNRLIGVTAKNLAIEIRSLAPDAAKALAAHDAELLTKREKELGHLYATSLKAAMEDCARRARLSEVEMMPHDYQSCLGYNFDRTPTGLECSCRRGRRIAALAESQPAPATQKCDGCDNPDLWESPTPTSKPGTPIPDWHHTAKQRDEDGDKYFIICRRKTPAPAMQHPDDPEFEYPVPYPGAT